jgi:hypothetical protein
MSFYAGYKDVLINSYEGKILIKDIPQCISKSDVVDMARIILKPQTTTLNNIEYVLNPNRLDLEENIKDGFIKVVDYESLK